MAQYQSELSAAAAAPLPDECVDLGTDLAVLRSWRSAPTDPA